MRLVGGPNSCQGRLEIMNPSGRYGQACDLNVNSGTVEVVCKQLGCNPNGARRVDASK